MPRLAAETLLTAKCMTSSGMANHCPVMPGSVGEGDPEGAPSVVPVTLVGMSSVSEGDANLKALETPLDEALLGEVLAILEPVKDVAWPSGNWK